MYSIRNVISIFQKDKAFVRLVKPCLQACDDSLSKEIIRARINYYSEFLPKYRRYNPFYKEPYLRFHLRINKLLNPIYRIDELDTFWGKKLVILGDGDDLRYTLSLLQRSKWRNHFRTIGNDIRRVADLKEGELLIPAKLDGIDEYISLIKQRFPNVMVYRPQLQLLWAVTGNQYFDIFKPQEKEVVVDCGAYDGQTELEICKWGTNHIKKIYAFELDNDNQKLCLDCYKKHGIDSLVEFINKGTSNYNGEVFLASSTVGTTGSRIGEGDQVAEVVRIDDAICDDITLIKMDIEGAELDALKGAELSIRKTKPRLAICMYHKKSDLFEIPNYLLSIVPEYRFLIRHYSSNPWETVLYAYV